MKTVLITGAGRGLGKATAEAYHAKGFYVIATDIDTGLLSEHPKTNNYLTVQMDVSSEESVKKCYESILKKSDGLDVLISNAGIFDFYPVSESGSEKLNKMISVNVLGLINLTKYFIPLLEKGPGRLIVISSESYKVPSPFQPYSISKQMLEAAYKALNIELSVRKIKSVLIRPGAMQTQILIDTLQYTGFDPKSRFKNEFKNFVDAVPRFIGKISDTKKVAELILKAGTVKNPKPVYSINHNPLVTVLSILPARIKNFIIKRSIK